MRKKLNPNSKVLKYAIERRKGKTKKEAQILAGYATPTHATSIERSQEFQTIQRYFKDEFTAKMDLSEVADYLIDNIKQDGQKRIDRNARNGAIKLALDKLEPTEQTTHTSEKVLVILSESPAQSNTNPT